MTEPSARTFEIAERPEVPWLSVVLGYGPMLPFVGGAVLAWVTRGAIRAEFVLLTILYTASILLFLAGVRRGLSFRTAGGPRWRRSPRCSGSTCSACIALFAVVEGFAIVCDGAAAVRASRCISCSIRSRRGTAKRRFSSRACGRRRWRSR